MINRNIIEKNVRISIVATGGGAGAQNMLWQIPGISSVLIDCTFPYDSEFTKDYLGFEPEKYCSPETAVELAMQAYYRAYQPNKGPAIGIGCTASVASTVIHKGQHRIYIASVSENNCELTSIVLTKGRGEEARIIDGKICDIAIIEALNKAIGYNNQSILPRDINIINYQVEDATELAKKQFFKHPYFCADTGKRLEKEPKLNKDNGDAIFPGSFNPPHDGHFGMVESYCYYKPNASIIYCIETESPHKGDLTITDMLNRAKMLKGNNILFTKGLGLYLDKAKYFDKANIIIGIDSFIRLLDCKWGVDINELIEGFKSCGAHFYVVDRVIDGKLVSIRDQIFETNGLNFTPLDGRWDISSTELRNIK